MFIVVAYDIVEHRTRRRVMKLLENYCQRRQKSVFECSLDGKRFVELKSRMSREIDLEEDRVCYYHLCAACRERIEGIENDAPTPGKSPYTFV